jgi:hypothetical protein
MTMDNVENCDSYASDMFEIFIISTLRNAREIPYWISCFVYVVSAETQWCDVNKISDSQKLLLQPLSQKKCLRFHVNYIVICVISNFLL